MKSHKMQMVLKAFDKLSFEDIQWRGQDRASDARVPAWLEVECPEESAGPAAVLTELRSSTPSPAEASEYPAAQTCTLYRGNLLVVDDTSSIRDSLAKMLRAEGYSVEVAADGEDALRKYDAERIDLIVLDLVLPALSGWDLLQRFIRLNPRQGVILITGQELSEQCLFRHLLVGGSRVLLEKPLNPPLLLQTIEKVLNDTGCKRSQRVAVQCSLGRLIRPHTPPFWHSRCVPNGGLNE
ncbi:MAG: response regulator [Verrucomicrobia bacterium]|nr:response regulator [Verrucomicrobiota bacterium]